MVSEGLDTSIWEALEAAEMLSAGISDPSMQNPALKEKEKAASRAAVELCLKPSR